VSAGLPLGTRLLLFLYGTPNIVGCVLALAGLGLFFGGVISDWWLPIVLGLYAAGWLATPRDPAFQARLEERAAQASLLDQIDDLIDRSKKRLPMEATEKLQAIRRILESLMPKMEGLAGAGTIGMEQVFTLVNAISRDLPATIANYLKLPQAFANLHPIENGKTAKQLLLEQIDLLQGQLAKIADAAFRDDAEGLVVNGKYLKEKFHSTEFLPAGGAQ
jgi:ferritin-like metal-binding protein YciE